MIEKEKEGGWKSWEEVRRKDAVVNREKWRHIAN